MNFTNHTIPPTELPAIEEVSFHPLEKNYLLVERISITIATLVMLVLALLFFYFIDKLQDPLILSTVLLAFILFSGLAFFFTGIDFKYSGYALRERDVLYRSGWFIRKLRVVMLSRVQHVSIQAGPLERKFGLSSVSIFTAGASQADFTIKGIKAETAQNIKEWISQQANGDNYK